MRIRIFTLLACLLLAGCMVRTGQEAPRAAAPAQGHSALLSVIAQSAASSSGQTTANLPLKLPLKPKSVRFAVIGDTGTGERPQREVAEEMEAYRQVVGFTFVIMLGDNIYGGDSPRDFARKFEQPYKALLDAGVKFYASLGNHDSPDERLYKPFNMGGEHYYTFKKNDVAFFVLDSTYMNPAQLGWLEGQLRNSSAGWKICYFHHPFFPTESFTDRTWTCARR